MSAIELGKQNNNKLIHLFSRIGEWFRHTPISEIYLYFVLLTYPILPAYFVLFGVRVTTLIAAGCIIFLFTTPNFYNLRIAGPKIALILSIFTLYAFSAIFNNELFSSGFMSFLCNYFIVPLYFAVIVDTRKKFDSCATILILSGLLLCGLSILELMFHYNIFSIIETVDMGAIGSGSVVRFGIYRIESSFGQAIAFAIYLSFIVCLVAYKLYSPVNQTNRRQNFYLLVLLILNVFIFLTSSRFPIVVTLVADIVLFIKLKKRSKIKVLIAMCFVAAAIAAYTIIKGGSTFTSLFDNIISIFEGDTTKASEDSSGYRLSLYDFSKKVIGNDYIFGRGLHVNTTFTFISQYYGLFKSTSFDNGYIYLFLQQGFAGVIAWIIFCYAIISSAILSYKKRFNDDINFPILVMIFICLLNMFSVARLDESRMFMVIIGAYLGLDFHIYRIEETKSKKTRRSPQGAFAS